MHIEERQSENHHMVPGNRSVRCRTENRGNRVIKVFQEINQEALRLFEAVSSDTEEDYSTWNYSVRLLVIRLVCLNSGATW